MTTQHLLRITLLLALGIPLVVIACGDGEEEGEETTAGGDDETTGGESGGGGGGGEVAGGMQTSQGDVEPGEDDDEDGPAAGQPAQGGPTPGAAQQGGGAQGESPWGAPEAQSGEPLPRRPEMNSSARDHYREGIQAANAGNIQQARGHFEEAIDADPRAYKAIYNLGVLADRAGQENRALEYYRQALRIQPDYERAVEGVVRIHIRRGSVPDAIAFVEPLARRWIRNLHIQAIYADTLVQADRAEDAVTAARRALQRDERFVPAMVALVKANLRRGRTELAQSILEQALAIDANNAEVQYLKGRMAQDDNRLAEALAAYQRAAELRPDYAEARTAVGLQMLRSGNYEMAVRELEAAARLAPTLVSSHLNLGEAYRASKQWQRAKAEYDRVLEMQNNLAEVHFNLGLLYLNSGADFPGPDLLTGLNRAVNEFNTYRGMMGPRMPRDDQSQAYLEDLQRRIERENKRIEREKIKAEREAKRRAREAEQAQQPQQPAPTKTP